MAVDLNSRSLFLTIVEASSLLILNVLSLTGNTLVCISIYKNRRLRSTTNLYIIALAVSDLLSATFVMPFTVGVLITSKWNFGEAVCQLHAFFSLFVVYVSPITMGLTAVNRYVRMCKSGQQYRRLFSVKKSCAMLALVWTFVACYTLVPRLVGLQKYKFDSRYAKCSIVHLSEIGKMIHYGIVLTLFVLTPLTTTIISYYKVSKMIRQHNADVSATIRSRERNPCISRHEIRVSKSLFVVVLAFMICWIPLWVIVVLKRFSLVPEMLRNVELLSMFFLYFSNAINPFIYAGMNPLFRKEFRKIILGERRCNEVHGLSCGEEGKIKQDNTSSSGSGDRERKSRKTLKPQPDNGCSFEMIAASAFRGQTVSEMI